MMANTLALGAAYQRGLLPVSLKALEQAIRLNGAAVDKNLAALAWGRAVVAAPDEVERATRPPDELPAAPSCRTSSASWSTSRWMATAASCAGSSRSGFRASRLSELRLRAALRGGGAPRAGGRAGAHSRQ